MRTITVFGYVLCLSLVVLCASGVAYVFQRLDKADSQEIFFNAREAFLIDSLTTVAARREIAVIDSVAKAKDEKITQRDKKIRRLAASGTDAEQRADSLQALYEESMQYTLCDSVIEAKNEVIDIKNEHIAELDKQVIEYADLTLLFKSKSAKLEEIITSHEASIKTCKESLSEAQKEITAERKKLPRWAYAIMGAAGGAIIVSVVK